MSERVAEAGSGVREFARVGGDGHEQALWVRAAWLLPLGVLAAALAAPSDPVSWSVPWVPLLGVDLAFTIDGLSRLFLVLVAGVGVAVFFYAPGYLHGHAHAGRLILLLGAFLVAMTGTILADDLVVLFVFWEATSVLSFLLVGFDHEKKTSRDSAQHALLITVGGGMALLAGIVMIVQAAPGIRISDLAALDPEVGADWQFQAGVALILVGAMTKSAQFPFHFWLPDAMAAPTPVSAYLHSATMVNLGVYLLARMDEAMGSVDWWASALTAIGIATAAWGALQALRERDLKRILAWSTVSALGTLTLLIGLPNEVGALAFVAFLLAHALYKAPLFFVAGNVDHAVGTRVIDHLRGLRRTMPCTATAAVLAALSMAGLPSTIGFIAKDTVKLAKELSDSAWLVSASGLVVSAVAVAVAAVVSARVFFGRPNAESPNKRAAESLRLCVAPPALAAAGIATGLFPALVEPMLFDAARVIAPTLDQGDASLDAQWSVRAETWIFVLLLGVAIYAGWDRLHGVLDRLRFLEVIGPASMYERSLLALKAAAAYVSRGLQAGRLSRYTAITVGVALLAALPWALGIQVEWPTAELPESPGLVLGCGAVVLGAALAVRRADTLQRLLGLGVVGYGSAVVFLFGGAPDLAMTQLLVETVFVVVAAVTLLRYRELQQVPRPIVLHGSIAVGFGLLLAVLLFGIMQRPADDSMARYFLDHSVVQAHGRNVVNVIIVDFRGLDTLGEIAVVMLAALAAWPLMPRLRSAAARLGPAPRSVLLERTVAFLYWLMVVASAWLLLRGHNAPGGGFIAALVLVTATSAYAFAFGTHGARARMPLGALGLSALGLTLAAISGWPALALGEPYLTHQWGEIGVAGETIKVSTVLIFDLGVMLCVWGALGGFCLRLLESRR